MTFGQTLLNNILPPKFQVSTPLDSGSLKKLLLSIARDDPAAYVDVVSKLKRMGDKVSTHEGVSVGLDDIEPVYKTRDAIMAPALHAVKHSKSPAEIEKVILEVQIKMLQHTREHPGSMTAMALSGARGNIPQLMKSVSAPVATQDHRGVTVPWLIGKSYAEGLTAADYWVANNEARLNHIKSYTSITEPGDMSKILVNTLYPYTVTTEDCGTDNGLRVATADNHTSGRYLAKAVRGHAANTLLTKQVLTGLVNAGVDHVIARSPMTCEAAEGICKHCQGVNEWGKPHDIGINVGVRAANAMSEPLAQFALDAKHGARTLKGASAAPTGMPAFRQLLEVPQSFLYKAVVANHTGKVTAITPAPHGGFNLSVDTEHHYIPPNLTLHVKVGDLVHAGDALCEGISKPDEVVFHKGLGAGREHLVNEMHKIYRAAGVDLDRRHLELMARADLNYVRVLDPLHYTELVRGERITYGAYKAIVKRKTTSMSLDAAKGHVLGADTLHFTVGTEINPSVQTTLKNANITTVTVAVDPPKVEFEMTPLPRQPLQNPDWLARMSHRYLKESLLRGAHEGHESDLHGTHPVPAYAYGLEFGTGAKGRY